MYQNDAWSRRVMTTIEARDLQDLAFFIFGYTRLPPALLLVEYVFVGTGRSRCPLRRFLGTCGSPGEE